MARIESVLLGDNPIFGVDHLSLERAREKASRSQDFSNASEVIKHSLNAGAKGMVVSTHPRLRDLIEHLKTETDLLSKITFYPILPYVQGYVLKINERGMMNTLMEILNKTSLQDKFRIITKGGFGVLKKDFYQLFKLFVDIELLPLAGTKRQTIFLHDVLADLALSLGMKNIFETFQDHLHDNYKLEAGLVTKNFTLMVSALNKWNLKYNSIMTSFNKAGFQMNPSRQDCENSLHEFGGNVIAMSVLAGGYLKPDDAYEYLSSVPKINTAVIGISSVEHVQNIFDTFLKSRYPSEISRV